MFSYPINDDEYALQMLTSQWLETAAEVFAWDKWKLLGAR